MSLTVEQINECEKIFYYLDRDKDNNLSIDEVVLGLGALGKVCSLREIKIIKEKCNYYNLENFIALCEEKINFMALDNNLISYFKILESKNKPGYISKKNIELIIKKYGIKMTEKDLNNIFQEIGNENGKLVNIENLVNEMIKIY